jgi:hypothetical protein
MLSHPDIQRAIAKQRLESLHGAAASSPELRRRLGTLLVAAGTRLAPEARPNERRRPVPTRVSGVS